MTAKRGLESEDRFSGLRRLAWAASVSTFLLLALGAVVTGTGSGLGCGDHWPSCNGQLIPDLSRPNVVIEFTHRMVAALVSILVLWTAIWVWRWRTDQRIQRVLRSLSGAAVLLLLAQVALGAVTVKRELPPEIVMLHLATGMALFATMIILSLRLGERSESIEGQGSSSLPMKRLHWATALTALVTYLQIVLGAYVRHSGAGLACPDFPLCQGAIVPTLSGLTLIQFAHRLGALLVAVLVIWVAMRAWRIQRAKQASPLRLAITAVLLVLLQIAWGALTVLSGLDVLWATLHLATAAALLAVLLGLSLRTRSTLLRAGSSFSVPTPQEAVA
jgi:cytochrome c oxidase assembly protein subunit 15